MSNLKKFPLMIPFSISLILVILILTLPIFLPPKLPLFYSLPWGEGQMAETKQFLIIPAMILFLTLTNLIISRQLHPQQVLFKTVLTSISIFISIILGLTFLKIILIFI